MKIIVDHLKPNPAGFAADPLGYSALAWHKWAMAQTAAGFPVDLKQGPAAEDLKSPVLWLAHAHAMSEAAVVLLRGSPNIDLLPEDIRGVAHCQYHAVCLMLVGYSLEIALKAMLIIKKGVSAYAAEEKQHHHHSLEKLADFVPNLNEKDRAVLKGLSHFVRWAGRYPDPGFGKQAHAAEIFSISEQYEVSASELFELAARVMKHMQDLLGTGPEWVRE